MDRAKVSFDTGAQKFRLEETFYASGETVPYTIEIGPGFEFAASVPRGVWVILSRLDLSLEAPLVHDWIYRFGPATMGISRKEADLQFYEDMLARGVKRWKAGAAYRAVRLLGRKAWRSR